MSTQSLVLFNPDSPTVIPDALQLIRQWTDYVASKRVEDPLPVNALGQSVADEIREAISKGSTFLSEYEKAANAAREPFYERFKAMKAASDAAILAFAEALGALASDLRDFEAEKRRVEERINRQREEEAARAQREEEAKARAAEEERRRAEKAERDRLAEIERQQRAEQDAQRRAELERQAAVERERQAQAEAIRAREREQEEAWLAKLAAQPVEKFESARTEGANVKTPFAYEVTDVYALLAWCCGNRPGWVNEAKLLDAFYRREITAAINQPDANHEIPGVRVYRELVLNVKKQRTTRAIAVQSSRVEL
jgi:hypothetical protein